MFRKRGGFKKSYGKKRYGKKSFKKGKGRSLKRYTVQRRGGRL